MYDICCIGHITLDKVVTTQSVVHMAGGTAVYFANALRHMNSRFVLVTALAEKDQRFVQDLRDRDIEVIQLPSRHTVFFENIYPENQDLRTQRVLQVADPFTVKELQGVDARIYHLGPLLAGDIPVELIRDLSGRGIVSLDVQGYLRKVENENVVAIDWPAKEEALQYIDILKASGSEMEVLTGQQDVQEGARILAGWGVKEVIITLGSMGSVIYKDHTFFDIPAYRPSAVIDCTGCGDTYMAGYLSQLIQGVPTQEAGEFAAAMASLKVEASGPFTGTQADVERLLAAGRRRSLYHQDFLERPSYRSTI